MLLGYIAKFFCVSNPHVIYGWRGDFVTNHLGDRKLNHDFKKWIPAQSVKLLCNGRIDKIIVVRANLKWLDFQVYFCLLWRRVWFCLCSLKHTSISWTQPLLKLTSNIFKLMSCVSFAFSVPKDKENKWNSYFQAFLCLLSVCSAKCTVWPQASVLFYRVSEMLWIGTILLRILSSVFAFACLYEGVWTSPSSSLGLFLFSVKKKRTFVLSSDSSKGFFSHLRECYDSFDFPLKLTVAGHYGNCSLDNGFVRAARVKQRMSVHLLKISMKIRCFQYVP